MDYMVSSYIYDILFFVYLAFLILLQIHFGRTGNRKAAASLIKVSFLISIIASAALTLYAYWYSTTVYGFDLHILSSIVAFVIAWIYWNITTLAVWVIDSYYRKKDKS